MPCPSARIDAATSRMKTWARGWRVRVRRRDRVARPNAHLWLCLRSRCMLYYALVGAPKRVSIVQWRLLCGGTAWGGHQGV